MKKEDAMTIGNALNFIKKGLADGPLRDRLNSADNCEAMQEVLTEEGLVFSPQEFEDAINSLLVKCQSAEAADQLREFQMWWQMLEQINGIQLCQSNCSGCCH